MRFGISLTHHDLARAQRQDERGDTHGAAATGAALDHLVALAEAAKEGGARAIWVSEDPEGWDAFAILTLLATRTENIALGTGVTSPLLRHPNQLAAAFATLDVIAGGRAFLGIGRGEPAWYRHGLGVPVPDPPLDGVRRTVELLREWWGPAHHVAPAEPPPVGTVFPVRDWERSVNPWSGRASPPPIVIAAAGPRALRLAGAIADGVLFNDLASDAWLEDAIATVRDSAAAAGRDPASLRFTYATRVLVTDDPAPELERRKTMLALINALPGMERPLEGAGHDIPTLIGAIRELLGRDAMKGGGFPELRRTGQLGAAAKLVPTDLVARLTVIGPTDYVRRRLAGLAELGIDEVFVQLPPTDSPAGLLRDRLLALQALS